jgi:large subunit ribosomal protein L21
MYAIIVAGGHQYRVQPEAVIEVNRLAIEQGQPFETEQVLLVETDGNEIKVGNPYVAGAKVTGTVIEHCRGKKVIVFKMRRRKNYRRKRGHRQDLSRVRIERIEAN